MTSFEEIILKLQTEGFEHADDLVTKLEDRLNKAGKEAILTGTKFKATGRDIKNSLSVSSSSPFGKKHALKKTERYTTDPITGDMAVSARSYRLVTQKEAKLKQSEGFGDEKKNEQILSKATNSFAKQKLREVKLKQKEAQRTKLKKQRDKDMVWKRTHMETEVTSEGKTQTSISYWKDKQGKKHIESQRKLTKETGHFKMELLSVLFASQQISQTFKGLLAPTLEMSGVFETFGVVISAVMLPFLEPLIGMFYGLMDVLLGLGEPIQFVIGMITTFIAVGAGIVTLIASWGLLFSGFGGIAAAFAGAIAILLSPISLVIGAIILAIAWMYTLETAWSQNWYGIRDKVTSVVAWITSKLSSFKEYVADLVKEPLKKLMGYWDTFKTNLSDLWDKLLTLGKTFGGNLVQKIIDGIKGMASAVGTAIWAPINLALNALGKLKSYVTSALGIGTPGGFLSSPYTTKSGVVYEGIHSANGMYDMNSGHGGNNIMYAPMINITANISNDIDMRHLADKLDTLMQERMRKYVRGT